MTDTPPVSSTMLTGELADLLETLRIRRGFLRHTLRDLTDEQASSHPTVSELCLGGIVKHVADVESSWVRFIVEGPDAIGGMDDVDWEERATSFQMLPGETVSKLLEGYDEVASRTDRLIASLPSLDQSQPLPEAPWFEPGARWSARRVLLHVIAETSHHAGHADILRESIDGSKTMG